MKQNNADYQVVPSMGRRAMAVAMRSVQRTTMIHGLIEVDVTRARAFLRDHKTKTGESLSFTAFIATCLGKAVGENKAVQAFRKGHEEGGSPTGWGSGASCHLGSDAVHKGRGISSYHAMIGARQILISCRSPRLEKLN
jgi:hypothetical protein